MATSPIISGAPTTSPAIDLAAAAQPLPPVKATPEPTIKPAAAVPAETKPAGAPDLVSVLVSFFENALVALGLRKSDAQLRQELNRSAQERILENESLGGDKTDDEYKPMLAAALKRIDDLATTVPNPGSPAAAAAMDELLSKVKRELRMPAAEWQARESFARSISERILENESLGGDKTDNEYIPMLNKALEAIRDKAFTLEAPGSYEYRTALKDFETEICRQLRDGTL